MDRLITGCNGTQEMPTLEELEGEKKIKQWLNFAWKKRIKEWFNFVGEHDLDRLFNDHGLKIPNLGRFTYTSEEDASTMLAGYPLGWKITLYAKHSITDNRLIMAEVIGFTSPLSVHVWEWKWFNHEGLGDISCVEDVLFEFLLILTEMVCIPNNSRMLTVHDPTDPSKKSKRTRHYC